MGLRDVVALYGLTSKKPFLDSGDMFISTDENRVFAGNARQDIELGRYYEGFHDDDVAVTSAPTTSISSGIYTVTYNKVILIFNDNTRTFTIRPNPQYRVYQGGLLYYITKEMSVTIPATEGNHHFYIDKGVLKVLTGTFDGNLLIMQTTYVANVYWDNTNSKNIAFGNELHGSRMPNIVHLDNHFGMGTIYRSGLALTGFTVPAGGTSADAKYYANTGIIQDEDIVEYIPVCGSGQSKQMQVYYIAASSLVRTRVAIDDYPLVYAGQQYYISTSSTPATYGAATRLPFNNIATGALTAIGANNYVLTHIFATNDPFRPVIAYIGQTEYTTASDAQTGAQTEINNIISGGLPFQEFVTLGTIINQSSTGGGFNTTTYSKVIATTSGGNYVDFRKVKIAGGASTSLVFETNTANIKPVGTVSVGTLLTVPRADHIHPKEYLIPMCIISLSGNQTTGNGGGALAVNDRIKFNTIVQNFLNGISVTISGSSIGLITLPIGYIFEIDCRITYVSFSGTAGYLDTKLYNVSDSAYFGISGETIPVTYTTNLSSCETSVGIIDCTAASKNIECRVVALNQFSSINSNANYYNSISIRVIK